MIRASMYRICVFVSLFTLFAIIRATGSCAFQARLDDFIMHLYVGLCVLMCLGVWACFAHCDDAKEGFVAPRFPTCY